MLAVWLGCAVFVVGGVFALVVSRSDGVDHFYKKSTDSFDYRLVAESPFGNGSAFDGHGRGALPRRRIGTDASACPLSRGRSRAVSRAQSA